MIIQGTLQLLRNMIVNDFTICHIFLYFLVYAFYNTAKNYNKIDGTIFIIEIILFIFEFLNLLVFLEIIELKFCGLNKNLKSNIEERAKLDLENINDRTSSDKIEINEYEVNLNDNEKEGN